MNVEAYRKRSSEISDWALRQIVYEKREDYEPEAIEAAWEELNLRNKDISDLCHGDTITLGEVIGRLDFDACVNEMKELDPEVDSSYYYELLVRHSQTEPTQKSDAAVHFERTDSGSFSVSVISPDSGGEFDLSRFFYADWLAASIKKADIMRWGRETITALCLLKMTEKLPAAQKHGTTDCVCPFCGAVCDPSTQFCPSCGAQQPLGSRQKLMEASRDFPRFCQNCGEKLELGQCFCPACGKPVQVSGPVETETTCKTAAYSPLAGGSVQATGGLKVWLWICIVCGIIAIIYYFIQAFAVSSLGGGYVFLMLATAAVMAVEVYGGYHLLKGLKKGFYIICGCVGGSLIFNLISSISAGNGVSFIVGLIGATLSLGIIWLLARKQWKYFR